jgi:hypothetical protein
MAQSVKDWQGAGAGDMAGYQFKGTDGTHVGDGIGRGSTIDPSTLRQGPPSPSPSPSPYDGQY